MKHAIPMYLFFNCLLFAADDKRITDLQKRMLSAKEQLEEIAIARADATDHADRAFYANAYCSQLGALGSLENDLQTLCAKDAIIKKSIKK